LIPITGNSKTHQYPLTFQRRSSSPSAPCFFAQIPPTNRAHSAHRHATLVLLSFFIKTLGNATTAICPLHLTIFRAIPAKSQLFFRKLLSPRNRALRQKKISTKSIHLDHVQCLICKHFTKCIHSKTYYILYCE
jgi:hypothetical protein